MTRLNNEIRELNVDELDAVSGGDMICMLLAARTIGQISGVLTDAINGAPVQTCHTPSPA